VLLVTARRDAYVAGFQLLNAMGQAEAQDLGLDGGPLYDPLGNYRRVASNWNDWARDPKYVPISTRTVDSSEMPPNPIVTPDVVAAPFAPANPPPPAVGPNPVTTAPAPATQGVTQPNQ
jgi:outer membrane protein